MKGLLIAVLMVLASNVAHADELQDLQTLNAVNQLVNWYNTPDKPVYGPGAGLRPQPQQIIVVVPDQKKPNPYFQSWDQYGYGQ